MADTEGKPNYEHDCDRCRFLGSGEYQGQPVDLYVCGKQGPNLPTVIARFSSEPSDTTSGIHAAAQFMVSNDYQDHPLCEALRRALTLAANLDRNH